MATKINGLSPDVWEYDSPCSEWTGGPTGTFSSGYRQNNPARRGTNPLRELVAILNIVDRIRMEKSAILLWSPWQRRYKESSRLYDAPSNPPIALDLEDPDNPTRINKYINIQPPADTSTEVEPPIEAPTTAQLEVPSSICI